MYGGAASLSREEARTLADLEWRSRAAAWDLYVAAGRALEAYTDRSEALGRQHEGAIRWAYSIVDPLGLPPGEDALAASGLWYAALAYQLVGLDLAHRQFLTRAWRRFRPVTP